MWRFVVRIVTLVPKEAVTLHESWHVLPCVFINAAALLRPKTAALCAGPVRPQRGRFWWRSIISNGSGSHNGGTLSDLLGMHCGRQRGHFDLATYVHRSVPCLKSDLLSDIALPKSISGSVSLLWKKEQTWLLPILPVGHTGSCVGQNYSALQVTLIDNTFVFASASLLYWR